jgi:hypothetical protein
MELGKINEDGTLSLFNTYDDAKREKRLRNAGCSDVVLCDPPSFAPGEKVVDTYETVDGKIIQAWQVVPDDAAIRSQINELKERLSATDYQVIKCMECTMKGESLPYDLDAVTAERAAWRSEINELEKKLL